MTTKHMDAELSHDLAELRARSRPDRRRVAARALVGLLALLAALVITLAALHGAAGGW